jgi:hypothetical protein
MLMSNSTTHIVVEKNIPNLPWLKPTPGWVKLNCDGSFKYEDGTAGAGMILRDDTVSVIFSACRQLTGCGDPLEASRR